DAVAGEEIAETLISPRHEDRNDPDEIGARQDVDEPKDVAHRARGEGDRRAGLAHDPQTVQSLPRSTAGVENLERNVVSGEDDEGGDRPDGRCEAVGERV